MTSAKFILHMHSKRPSNPEIAAHSQFYDQIFRPQKILKELSLGMIKGCTVLWEEKCGWQEVISLQDLKKVSTQLDPFGPFRI